MAILLGILFVGLNPKDYNFSNDVRWITDQSGIRFRKYGIAYTKPFEEIIQDALSGPNGFSIDIALKPLDYRDKGFNFILALHNGKDRSQLLLGQWRSWLILMNGDDYNHKKKTKRISFNAASLSPAPRFLTITTGSDGTHLYVDGQLFRTKKDLTLKIPDGANSRLILGNSVYGRHPWQGDVYGLAFYGNVLSPQDAIRHHTLWSKTRSFKFSERDNPVLAYFLDEKNGVKALAHGSGGLPLEIPSRMQILQREILSSSGDALPFNRNTIQDIIINLLGFIPLGYILTATVMQRGGRYEKHAVLITLALCFMVSLLIETVQAWLPSRSSQMLDLTLNTLGALSGGIICRLFLAQPHRENGLNAGD
jgi:VanZ family protein